MNQLNFIIFSASLLASGTCLASTAPPSFCGDPNNHCTDETNLTHPSLWNEANYASTVNNEDEFYQPGQIQFTTVGGQKKIIITGSKSAAKPSGKNFISGKMDTSGKVTTLNFGLHGVVEAEIELPTVSGVWPAFWMMPQAGPWPTFGENDILEWMGRWPNPRAFASTEHGSSTPNGDHQGQGSGNKVPSNLSSGDTLASPHYYAMEWNIAPDFHSGDLTFYFDGKTFYQFHLGNDDRSTAVLKGFQKGFYPILNLAIGGDLGGDDSKLTSATMTIDNIAMYKVNGSAPTGCIAPSVDQGHTGYSNQNGVTLTWDAPAGKGYSYLLDDYTKTKNLLPGGYQQGQYSDKGAAKAPPSTQNFTYYLQRQCSNGSTSHAVEIDVKRHSTPPSGTIKIHFNTGGSTVTEGGHTINAHSSNNLSAEKSASFTINNNQVQFTAEQILSGQGLCAQVHVDKSGDTYVVNTP